MPGIRVPHPTWRTLFLSAGMLALTACGSLRFLPGGCSSGRTGYSQRTTPPAAYVERLDGVPGVVTGDVRDATTGGALRGASVRMEPGGYRATTDSSGTFRFDGIGAGRKTVSARRYTHISQSAVVQVEVDQGAGIAFQLVSDRCDDSISPFSEQVRKPTTVPRSAPPRIP